MAVIANRSRSTPAPSRQDPAAHRETDTHEHDTHEHDTHEHRGLKHWPLGRRAWAFVATAYAVIVVLATALGLFIVHVLEDGPFGRADLRVSEWFADRRSETINDVAHTVSFVSDSVIVIPLCAVLLAVFLIAFRRWHESILVIGALLLEKAIFLPATFIVDRDRPPIGQLAGDPPSSSFFSGHVAAAVAFYFGLYVVVRWHTDSSALRRAAAVFATAAVVAVALSRLLEGMHYLSDVIVGATIGALSILVVGKALAYDRDAPQELSAMPTASNVP